MRPKRKCPECKWVAGDHAQDCLIGAAQEAEEYGIEVEPPAEADDELEDDDDDDE